MLTAAAAIVAAAGCAPPRGAAEGPVAVRIARGPAFTLAGPQVFRLESGAPGVRWIAERLDSAASEAADTVARRAPAVTADTVRGARATFTLAAPGSASVAYRIVAQGRGDADTVQVRIFPPDVRSSFVHHGAAHPPVRTFVCVPRTLGPATRLVIVMHGTSRNADGYADSWTAWSAAHDYLAATPEFGRADWGGSARYNLGNVVEGAEARVLAGEGARVPEGAWSFTVVDELQARLRRDFGLGDPAFDLWGHSAGAQFVHRFLLFKPASPVRLAIAANAGWYTPPEPDVPFPFGARHPALALDEDALRRWTRRPMLLMRGTADTLRDDDLRTDAAADRQGRTRYARAAFMLERARALDPATAWRLEEVPGVGHSQRGMAPAAQAVLAARRRAAVR